MQRGMRNTSENGSNTGIQPNWDMESGDISHFDVFSDGKICGLGS